jgi:UDP-glucose 4-epimerase
MNEKVIITGGSGFIGSNLSEELVKRGYEVIVIDNLATGRIENIESFKSSKNFSFVKGSINDLEILKKHFEGAYCVFHQAAIPSVQRSVENPIASNQANVDGTLNVLVAAKDCNVKKVMYASSSSVYGDTPILPKQENMAQNPKSPYAVSKLAGEQYCRAFSNVYGLKTTCLRYFNVFGPRQDPKSHYAAIIPILINKAINGERPAIYGDGNQTRDFTFVKDVVKANILAMESDSEGIFNIACNRRTSLNQLIEKISSITGKKIDPMYTDTRKGDVKDSLADITLARKHLGYEPDYDIDKGLELTIKWFQKN